MVAAGELLVAKRLELLDLSGTEEEREAAPEFQRTRPVGGGPMTIRWDRTCSAMVKVCPTPWS